MHLLPHEERAGRDTADMLTHSRRIAAGKRTETEAEDEKNWEEHRANVAKHQMNCHRV
jgi:hypothetical protein